MNILPRDNVYLLGHTEAEQLFLQAWKNDVFPSAWIISGARGIGKSTLAYRLAKFLFTADNKNKNSYMNLNVDANNEVCKQITSGSYPDLKVIERDYTETELKKVISAIKNGDAMNDEELSSLKKSAYIRVDEIRKIKEFLAKKSFNEGWRVIIIDSADEMNKNAANALLKILEEPPLQTVFLLISHNPGILLPTIKSRCAKIVLHNLSDNEVASLLRRYRPELDENIIEKIVKISDGSIGKALKYVDVNAIDIYDKICDILYARGRKNLHDFLNFCNEMTDDDNFNVLQELLEKWIKENILTCSNKEEMFNCWQKMQYMFADCRNVNMDKKQTLINLFNDISKAL